MKTTIDIPTDTLEEAIRYSGARTKREAVVTAMEEYNRRRRLAELADKLGTFTEVMDLEELHRLRSED